MNREWQLISIEPSRDPGQYKCCPDDTFPSVTFKIVLQRHSGSYTAIVVVPAAGEYKYAYKQRSTIFFFFFFSSSSSSSKNQDDTSDSAPQG
jgi:hypothetical protein